MVETIRDYTINTTEDVYYKGRYWNDFPQTVQLLNELVSGHPVISWQLHFHEWTGHRRFRKALILNCGNGWVERELIEHSICIEAVGIDCSSALLEEAREKARAGGLQLRYYEMDVNTANFPEAGYDLVVNHAAGHHIAYIDRVFRALSAILDDDGYFVGFDYVGPHRNQYPYAQWKAACRVNETIPPEMRQDMRYPHLPTMIATDPTEAIHSELLIATLEHYFEVERLVRLGGAIAYLILTFNDRLFKAGAEVRERWVGHVLEQDRKYSAEHPESSLFAYYVARPRKLELSDEETLRRREAEEVDREERAKRNGGYYYPLTPFQKLNLALDEAHTRIQQLVTELARRVGK
jgi:SAM-dependent methyltransferase